MATNAFNYYYSHLYASETRRNKFMVARKTVRHRQAFRIMVAIFAGLSWLASMGVTVLYGLFAGGYTSNVINSNYAYNIFTFTWAMLSALVDMIMRIGMETCATTSVTAVIGAVLAISFPPDDVIVVNFLFIFIAPLSSLYVLTFISTLRARETAPKPASIGPAGGE
ncbi:hypothetical protein RQP46_009073 [Phenoliferia psychrophenolica]